MKYTEKYEMNLPEKDDFYDVEHFNENFSKIDEELKKNEESQITDESGIHGIRYHAGNLQVQDVDGSWVDAGVMADAELSEESTNPIQNKAVTMEINALKKSVSDGKTAVASAITAQGVATEPDAAFATMAENIIVAVQNKYNTAKVGTAGVGDVLAGKTFTNTSSVGEEGTMPDRSCVIQTAITDTNDKNKSVFRTNGTNIEVIPAVGFWGAWDWSKEKIIIPASGIGITANKILKGNTICGVVGTGTGETHGARIVVNIDTSLELNQVMYLYLEDALVAQQTATVRNVVFDDLLTVGTYIIKYAEGYADVAINADQILNNASFAVTVNGNVNWSINTMPDLEIIKNSSSGTASLEKTTDYYEAKTYKTRALFAVKTPVNLTPYKRVIVDINSFNTTETYWINMGFLSALADNGDTGNYVSYQYSSITGRRKLTYDVSQINASVYFGFKLYDYHIDGTQNTLHLYSVTFCVN